MRGAAGIAALGAMALAACTPNPATEPAQPIDVQTDWAQVPVDAAWGEVSAVDVDSHGHVFVLQRAGRTWSEPFPTQPIARPVVFMFDADGGLLAQWGVPGKSKNGLNLPHGVAFVDGWVYIADRENRRIKVHRGDGALIAIWDVPGHPYAVKAIRDGRIATLEGRDAGGASIAVLRLWSAGGVQEAAFDLGARLGGVKGHDLAIGPDGTVYIADVEGRRLLTARLPRSNGN